MRPVGDPQRRRGGIDPAAPGATVGRRIRLGSEDPDDRLSEAAVRFNSSQAARIVAGLSRALGHPRVSVGAIAGSQSEVRVTVAWELSWYQWGVDVADEKRPVFEIAKGTELDQLDGSARQWNAKAATDGRLSLGVSARSQAGDRAATL